MLEGIGAQIAGKLPRKFWDVLRDVAAKVTDRPITLQLNSAEPYVPWELAWMEAAIDPERPSFLGAQVVRAIGHWGTTTSSRRRVMPGASARWPSWWACTIQRPV